MDEILAASINAQYLEDLRAQRRFDTEVQDTRRQDTIREDQRLEKLRIAKELRDKEFTQRLDEEARIRDQLTAQALERARPNEINASESEAAGGLPRGSIVDVVA